MTVYALSNTYICLFRKCEILLLSRIKLDLATVEGVSSFDDRSNKCRGGIQAASICEVVGWFIEGHLGERAAEDDEALRRRYPKRRESR